MTLRINGEPIPNLVVEQEIRRLVHVYGAQMNPKALAEYMPKIRRQAKDHAIGRKLLLNEARQQELDIPAPEIETEIDGLIKTCGSAEALDRHLTTLGKTRADLRQDIFDARQIEALVEIVTADIAEPQDEDAAKYYELHEGEFVQPDQADVGHILIKAEGPDKQNRAIAQSKLLCLKDQLEHDADFAELAMLHSECPSGQSSGGELGLISRGVMPPAFETAAFSLPEHAVSDPVETDQGWHVIRKNRHVCGSIASFDDVKDKIRELLFQAMKNMALTEYIETLKKEARIEDDASPLDA